MNMKLGMLGGTFNPIHNSHLYLARAFCAALELDRLVLVPACLPPHKEVEDLAGPMDRLEMCRLAAAENPRFCVSGFEVERGGKSYTVDTLRHLQGENPGAQLYLLMGGDMFLTLETWREAPAIYQMAVLCAAARQESALHALAAKGDALEALGARCIVLDIPAQPLSSTVVRERLRRGEDVSGLLPPAVYEYIQRKSLYRKG